MDFYGIEKLSMVDFDGYMCTTLFTGGCNMRCPFCQNGQLVCMANQVQTIPFDEILEYLKKRSSMIEAVCITGGEPTIMPDLVEKIEQIKELGYLVKLDSNGSNPNVLETLLKKNLLDYIAMDVKNSKEKYAQTIGVSNMSFENIKKSINIIQHSGLPYEFRTTLVSEFHSKEDIEKIGKMLQGSEKMYLQHFKESEFNIQKGLHEVFVEDATAYVNILKKYIKNVELRGY